MANPRGIIRKYNRSHLFFLLWPGQAPATIKCFSVIFVLRAFWSGARLARSGEKPDGGQPFVSGFIEKRQSPGGNLTKMQQK